MVDLEKLEQLLRESNFKKLEQLLRESTEYIQKLEERNLKWNNNIKDKLFSNVEGKTKILHAMNEKPAYDKEDDYCFDFLLKRKICTESDVEWMKSFRKVISKKC